MAAANPIPFPETHAHPNPAPEQMANTETAPWCAAVLDLLAEGASITAAMRHVGYSVSAFRKTCKRHPEFRLAANRARNTYRAKVAEDFHESEAYARMLVDAVQRDEQLPASLRLRAALAILNRKPDRWLPSPIRTPDDPVDTVDTVDTFDALAELAYHQLLTESLEAEDFSHPDQPNPAEQGTLGQPATGAVETVETVDTLDTVDNTGTGNTVDTVDNVSNIDKHEVDTTDKVDTIDTVDNADNLADFACRQTLPGIERMNSSFPSVQPGKRPAESATAPAPGDSMDTVDTANTMDTIDIVGIQNPRTFMTGVRQGEAEVR